MAENRGGRLEGRRVLIAEDSFPVALVIETALEAEGAAIAACVASLEEASALARTEPLDLAVVDLQLGAQDALPLIRLLREKGVAVLVASGRDPHTEIKQAISGLPVLRKPYTAQQLIEEAEGALQ